jgi:prepilin-type processing-associated H-X9-DG protein
MFLMPFAIAAVLVSGDGNASEAYTGFGPVAIATCTLKAEWTYDQVGGGDAVMFVPKYEGENLTIQFSNSTSQVISSVNFAVTDGLNTQQIVDRGTFSPGIAIDHSFQSNLTDEDNAQCRVSNVAFADGSTWTPAVASN